MSVAKERGRKRTSGWIIKLQSTLQLEVIWASSSLYQRLLDPFLILPV